MGFNGDCPLKVADKKVSVVDFGNAVEADAINAPPEPLCSASYFRNRLARVEGSLLRSLYFPPCSLMKLIIWKTPGDGSRHNVDDVACYHK